MNVTYGSCKSLAWISISFRFRGLRLLLNVILKLQAFRGSNLCTNQESESSNVGPSGSSGRQTSFSSSPELGDIMSVLLDQLDISWLDPDKSVTREILAIILTFVLSFKKIGKEEKREKESVECCDDGILTKMIEGKKSKLKILSLITDYWSSTVLPYWIHFRIKVYYLLV